MHELQAAGLGLYGAVGLSFQLVVIGAEAFSGANFSMHNLSPEKSYIGKHDNTYQ